MTLITSGASCDANKVQLGHKVIAQFNYHSLSHSNLWCNHCEICEKVNTYQESNQNQLSSEDRQDQHISSSLSQ